MMKMMLTIVMKNDNHEIDDNIDYEHDDKDEIDDYNDENDDK